MENDYHNPYDHDSGGGAGGCSGESDHLNHYEAPPGSAAGAGSGVLARNPSGSLYIPSGKGGDCRNLALSRPDKNERTMKPT